LITKLYLCVTQIVINVISFVDLARTLVWYGDEQNWSNRIIAIIS